MRSDARRLAGLRILVVEDTALVAEVIADQLEGWGCQVIGPVGRVEPALELLNGELPHAALLDINLAGELSFPVAERLEAGNVPYIYMSGYEDAARLPPEQRGKPMLTKPFTGDMLLDRLLPLLDSLA